MERCSGCWDSCQQNCTPNGHLRLLIVREKVESRPLDADGQGRLQKEEEVDVRNPRRQQQMKANARRRSTHNAKATKPNGNPTVSCMSSESALQPASLHRRVSPTIASQSLVHTKGFSGEGGVIDMRVTV